MSRKSFIIYYAADCCLASHNDLIAHFNQKQNLIWALLSVLYFFPIETPFMIPIAN